MAMLQGPKDPALPILSYIAVTQYIFAICIFEQIASEKLNKGNVARTMRSHTLSHVKFENIYTFTFILPKVVQLLSKQWFTANKLRKFPRSNPYKLRKFTTYQHVKYYRQATKTHFTSLFRNNQFANELHSIWTASHKTIPDRFKIQIAHSLQATPNRK